MLLYFYFKAFFHCILFMDYGLKYFKNSYTSFVLLLDQRDGHHPEWPSSRYTLTAYGDRNSSKGPTGALTAELWCQME
jgi:hypothetical protein